MSIFPFAGKKEVVGIDLGTSNIKLLELKSSDDQLLVKNFAQKNIADRGVWDRSPQERKQIYIEELKGILADNSFGTKNAAVSISGSSVIVRFVKFPKMSPEDLQKTLQFEAEPHIPFNIQEVDMDTQIIGDVEVDGQMMMETILVASKKDVIQEEVEIIEQAGLKPSIVDVDAFALENAYDLVNKEASPNMIVLVNIGASTTNISIIEEGVSKVVRDLYTAGRTLTRAIMDELNLEGPDPAEKLKIKYGLTGKNNAGEQEPAESGKSEDEAAQVYEILYPVVRELNSEIQRSIDYFSGQQADHEVNIEKIVLSGGTASLKGLSDFVEEDLGIPVEIFRPLQNANIDKVNGDIEKKSPAYAVITGLASRKIGDNK
ncbi:MAG: type IV pilus assembly protein PilM [Elusimicrobiota bacterium]